MARGQSEKKVRGGSSERVGTWAVVVFDEVEGVCAVLVEDFVVVRMDTEGALWMVELFVVRGVGGEVVFCDVVVFWDVADVCDVLVFCDLLVSWDVVVFCDIVVLWDVVVICDADVVRVEKVFRGISGFR